MLTAEQRRLLQVFVQQQTAAAARQGADHSAAGARAAERAASSSADSSDSKTDKPASSGLKTDGSASSGSNADGSAGSGSKADKPASSGLETDGSANSGAKAHSSASSTSRLHAAAGSTTKTAVSPATSNPAGAAASAPSSNTASVNAWGFASGSTAAPPTATLDTATPSTRRDVATGIPASEIPAATAATAASAASAPTPASTSTQPSTSAVLELLQTLSATSASADSAVVAPSDARLLASAALMLWRNARDDELPQLQRLLGADSALRPHIAPMLLLHALSRLLRPRKRNGGETQHGLRVRPNDTPATVVARTIGRLPRRPASPAEAARELEVLTTAIQLLSAQELPAAYEAIFALRTQATWMTEWLSRLLASQLARRGGVAALLHMVLDDSRPTPVWEQADRAAAMVAGAITDAKAMAEEDGVSGDASAEQLASVCHQLLLVLRQPVPAAAVLQRAAVLTAARLNTSDAESSRRYFFAPLQRAFLPPASAVEAGVALPELAVDQDVTASHLVYVVHGTAENLAATLVPALPGLLLLFTASQACKARTLHAAKEILCGFVLSAEAATAAETLMTVLAQQWLPSQRHARPFDYAPGGTGGLQRVAVDTARDAAGDAAERLAGEVDAILRLCLSSQRQELSAALLEECVQRAGSAGEDAERLALVLHVVEVLFTEAGPKLFGQVRSILALLGALMALPQPETRHLCVSLLDVLLSGVVQIPQTEWAGLDALVPQLEEVAANCKATDAPMAQLAESCRAAIVSRDSRWSRIGSAASAGEAEASTADEPALHRILEQLQDPLLPARAHALMELRRLVLRKSPAIRRNLSYILGLFSSQLEDEDSYMYLTAINGLAAMGDVYPTNIIPPLVAEFLDTERTTETRLKVGEAVMKVARRCGEALPKYINLMLPGVLQGTRDADATFRASCLSNLGTLTQLLRFSLHGNLQEILNCVRSVVQHDPSPEARRGALHVLTEMLDGLEQDAFEVMGDALRPMLDLCRLVEETDEDAVVQFHARRVIGRLHHLANEFVKPKVPGRAYLP